MMSSDILGLCQGRFCTWKIPSCPWHKCLAGVLNVETGRLYRRYIEEILLNVTLNDNKIKPPGSYTARQTTGTVDGLIFVGTNFCGFYKNDKFLGFKIHGHSIFIHTENYHFADTGIRGSNPTRKITKIGTPRNLSHPQYIDLVYIFLYVLERGDRWGVTRGFRRAEDTEATATPGSSSAWWATGKEF